MMKNISKYIILLAAVVLWSCEPKVDEFSPSNGSADFTTFVAVGDSYTAGYTDGALGARGQNESFSVILANQLENVGSAAYNQPLVQSEGSVGTTVINEQGALNGYFELSIVGGSLAPVPTAGDMAIFGEQVYNADNQNFGVPGAKSYHLLASGFGNPAAGVGNYNPFYTRFMSSGSASVLEDALATDPSFVSLWIGCNDVLGYALEGGEDDMITPPADFANYMGMLASSLYTGDTKGALANIPSINALPYFNAVTYNALVIDQATADMLNAHPSYVQYNAGSEALGLPKIEFVAGANALVIVDEDYEHPGKIRQMVEGEKVILSASSSISNPDIGWGYIAPLAAKYVLDEEEVEAINAATLAYNKTIKTLCGQFDLAHVDLHAVMDQLDDTGVIIDGNHYTTTFVTGGVFSLDGIHASGRGSAIIANAFIEAINAEYNASVPLANVNDYDMVEFP